MLIMSKPIRSAYPWRANQSLTWRRFSLDGIKLPLAGLCCSEWVSLFIAVIGCSASWMRRFHLVFSDATRVQMWLSSIRIAFIKSVFHKVLWRLNTFYGSTLGNTGDGIKTEGPFPRFWVEPVRVQQDFLISSWHVCSEPEALQLCVRVYHLLQQVVLLHVLLGGGAGALCLLLEGFVGGHERSLLGEQRRQTTQQPATQIRAGLWAGDLAEARLRIFSTKFD